MNKSVKIFNARTFEKDFFNRHLCPDINLHFTTDRLCMETVEQTKGFDAICCFVTDDLSAPMLEAIKANGVKLIALRSAGFDHVDIAAAKRLQLPVVRVPSYSPNAIAEFAVGLILALSRKIKQSHEQVSRLNFSLENMLGFNLQGKTIGIIGTGKIGSVFAKIMRGFDCHLLGYDLHFNNDCYKYGVECTSKESIFKRADVISLHCPLNDDTKHMINAQSIAMMKPGVMIINTGRGGLIDTRAAIDGLNQGKIGGLGLDVYEHEHDFFFKDHSHEGIHDDLFKQLQRFDNVLITGHQAYLSREALTNIVTSTLDNIQHFFQGQVINSIQ